MKLIVRFFVFVCLLVLSGYDYLSAIPVGSYVNCSSVRVSQKPGIASASHTLFGAYTPSDVESKNYKVCFEEDEEDDEEVSSFKKHFVSVNYFTSYYSPALRTFCDNSNACQPLCTHFSLYSSNRYILYRSIRV